MQVRVTLKDGRQMDCKASKRYACFRLTSMGGFTTATRNSAEECVRFARQLWQERGFSYMVFDTHQVEAIAAYPFKEANWPKGQPMPNANPDFPEEACSPPLSS